MTDNFQQHLIINFHQFTMNLKTFFQLSFLIAAIDAEIFDHDDIIDVDTKNSFCGRQLGNILSFYCEEFFESSSPGYSGHQGIVEFCCSNPCTLRTLMSNYCKKTKKSFDAMLMLKQEPSSSNNLFQETNDRNAMSEKLQKAKIKPVSDNPEYVRCLRKKFRRRNCRNINPTHQIHQNHNSSHPLNSKPKRKRTGRKCKCCKESKKRFPVQSNRQKHPPRPANVGFDNNEPQSHIFVNQATYESYSFPNF